MSSSEFVGHSPRAAAYSHPPPGGGVGSIRDTGVSGYGAGEDCEEEEEEWHDARVDFSVAGGDLPVPHSSYRNGNGAASARADQSWPPSSAPGPPPPPFPGHQPLIDEDAPMPPQPGLPPAAKRLECIRRLRELLEAGEASAACAHLESRCDATLERFLRARDFRVEVAHALMLEHRRWRASFGWRIEPEQVSPMLGRDLKFIGLPGVTKAGRTIMVLHVSRHDAYAKDRDLEVIKKLIT